MGWLHITKCLPNRTVALETTPECNLPDSLSSPHPSLGLNHKRTQRSNIGLESTTSNCHELFRQRNSRLPIFILLLVHTTESLIISPAMGPHYMNKLILCSSPIYGLVREQNSRPPNSKQTIRYQHRLLIPKIPILSNILCTDNNSIGVPVHLQQILGEVNCNHTRTTAHTP
nr:Os06g0598850 [Ipomoea trifida]